MKNKIIIKIEGNEEATQYFLSWLCETGEQEYWDFMRYREEEVKKKNITILTFDYDFENKKITGKLGRLED